MTVKLLLSQPAGGKTTSCIKEIIEKRKNDSMAPVKVIVPDKMQMAYGWYCSCLPGLLYTEQNCREKSWDCMRMNISP